MLNEYIASKQHQITKEYRQKMASIVSSKEIQGRLDSLSKQLYKAVKTVNQKVNDSLSYRLLHRKEYNGAKKARKLAVEAIPKLKTDIGAAELALIRAKNQESQFRAEKRDAERKLKDKDYVINLLINADKTITNSIGFMLQCIEHNPAYIVYDTSNSNIVYEAFMKNFLENAVSEERLVSLGFLDTEIKNLRDKVSMVLKEIQEPQTTGSEEYKVPQKYLYEVIRSAIKNDSFEELVDGFDLYMSLKGSLSKSFGIAIDELYKDKNNYVFLHNVNYRGYRLPADEIQQRVASICQNGLVLSSMGNEAGKLEYTTLGNSKIDNLGFLRLADFAQSGDVIALSIPKHLVDKNGAYIGSNISKELGASNPGVILPEYVAGVFTNGQFVKNPCPESDMAKYKYVVKPNGTDVKEDQPNA